MRYLVINPPHFLLVSKIIFLLFFLSESRYPCLNDGEPILLGQNSNEFRCDCLTGFFGPFCEYQDTSQTIKEKSSTQTSTSLFSYTSNNVANTGQQRGWETTFVNLLICVFFLLLLPSLVIYAIRVLYLLLKRCHSYYNIQHRSSNATTTTNCSGIVIQQSQQNNHHPTPPPHYWAAMGVNNQNNIISSNNQQQRSLTWLLPLSNGIEQNLPSSSNHQHQQRMHRRRRSVSPITEVTVQLPTSICRGRPIHNTRSVGGPIPLHQSQSLTLAEFHELLLRIQQEMQTRQQFEGIEQQRNNTTNFETEQHNTSSVENYHNDIPNSTILPSLPIEPPPSYNELIHQ